MLVYTECFFEGLRPALFTGERALWRFDPEVRVRPVPPNEGKALRYADISGRPCQINFANTRANATQQNTIIPAQKYIGNVHKLYSA